MQEDESDCGTTKKKKHGFGEIRTLLDLLLSKMKMREEEEEGEMKRGI